MFDPRVRKLAVILIITLACGVTFVAGVHQSLLVSFLSFTLLSILCFTALPLCRFLFGGGVAPILLCYPVGYILHAFLLSLCGWGFGIKPIVFAVYFPAALLLSFYFHRRNRLNPGNHTPLLESWKSSDTVLLMAWLLVTLAAVAPAFLNVGAETEHGYAYRAYFNGDVFRNMATAGTLMRSGIPPENPYFAGFTLHYYWFFHTLPAFWMTLFPSYRPEFILIQFSLTIALAFVAALFATIRYLTRSRKTLLFLLPLFLLGGSYEGLFILNHLHEKNLPWTEFTMINVDGVLRWLWRLPQVDALYRPLLYAPQHLLGITSILIVLMLRTARKEKFPRIGSLLLLFVSVGFSVIVAAVGVLVVCLTILVELFQGKWKQVRPEIATGLIAGPLLLLLYFLGFHMVDPNQGALVPGIDRNLISRLFAFSFLQWGPILVFGLLGLLFAAPKDSKYAMLATTLILSATLLLFLRIDVLGMTEIGLKTGYIIDVALLLLSALFADRVFSSASSAMRKWFIAGAVIIILPASITWMMDAYNSQDVKNGRFTTFISKEKMEMFEWIRNNLEPQAKVQDFRIRNPDFLGSYISEIPPFANRPMYLGDVILSEIFQIPPADLQKRRKISAQLLNMEDPKRICNVAQKEKISHFLVWKKDGAAFQQDQARRYFKRIHEIGEITVFKVTEEKPRLFDGKWEILMEDYVSGDVLIRSSYETNFYPPETANSEETFRWMPQNAEIIIESVNKEKGILSFMAESFIRNRTMIVSQEGKVLLQQSVGPRSVKISVPLELPEGGHRLKIESLEGADPANLNGGGTDTRPISFKIWLMQFRSVQE